MSKKEKLQLQVLTAVVAGVVSVSIGGGHCNAALAAESEDAVVEKQAVAVADFGDEDVVVTATRTEKHEKDIPAATEVITAEEIKLSGAMSAADALSKVNGLVFKSVGAWNQSMGTMSNEVIVRGYGGGTLIMLNGTPISMRGKYDLASISADSIERIEIIKGNGSTLYGSEALAGVVNIITKKGVARNSITTGIGNHSAYKYGLNVGDDDWSFTYNRQHLGSKLEASDISGVSGYTNTQTNYWTRDLERENANIAYKLSDKWDLTYNFSQSTGYIDRYVTGYAGAPAGAAKVGDLWQTRKYNVTQHNGQLNFHDNDWKINLYMNHGYIQSKGETYFSKAKKKLSPYNTKERHDTYGVDGQKTWHFGDKTDFTAGVNYKRESYVAEQTESTKERSNYDRNNWAVFAQFDHKFDAKNSFIIGGRETWTTGAWRNANYSNFSASAAWLHKMNEENNLYASVSQSFMMPTFSQMYTNNDWQAPNPDLKPQHGVNYELGWKQQHGNHFWKAAVFHMDIEDNITAKKDSLPGDEFHYSYTNEDFKNTGVELSCTIDGHKDFSYKYGITWQNPQSKSSKEDYWKRVFGKLQLDAGIGYKKGKFQSNLTASYLCGRVITPSTGLEERVKPYFLTTWNFIYSPTKDFDITLTIDNVLDRHDNTMHSSSKYYAAPTSCMLGLTYKF